MKKSLLSALVVSLPIIMGFFSIVTPVQALVINYPYPSPTPTPTPAPTSNSTITTAPVMTTRQETVCQTTAYGLSNCHVVVTQVPVHVPISAGLPNVNAIALVLAAILVLSTAGFIKFRRA